MIYEAPVRDMMFLADEWIGLDNLRTLPGYGEVESEIFEAILEEAGKFCATELLPINRDGDEHGATLADGKVTTPPGFKQAYDRFTEGGWTGIDADPDHGGQGLPKLLQYFVDEMTGACNLSFKLYPELSHGAYHLLASHAPPEIRETYLPRMVEGSWSGTMCLTEPHCGTDLGLLKTRAAPADDGSYRLSGTKIFITSGDHDLTENILHLVLARIDGAPEGTRGVSLFLVPKTLVNADGSLGEPNTVSTGSIEHKMGIRGSATCVLNFDDARGILVGEPNRGLAAMFRMMNIERLTVGVQGLGIAEIAYQNARRYANERLQSKAPAPRPAGDTAADPIIYQPEVQRMLMTIRCQVDGARALVAFAGYQVDIMEKADDEATARDAEACVALLTPVVKSFLSDLGVESALAAQQVFGGHGYVSEHGMEQLVRDCRITQIYEGTNEVQANDLVTRKLTGGTGEFADRFLKERKRILAEYENEKLDTYVEPALAALERLTEATAWLRTQLESDEAAARGAATQYLRLFALSVIAALWADIIASIRGKDGSFYDVKRKVARFYIDQVLPETTGLYQAIVSGADALRALDVEDFAR